MLIIFPVTLKGIICKRKQLLNFEDHFQTLRVFFLTCLLSMTEVIAYSLEQFEYQYLLLFLASACGSTTARRNPHRCNRNSSQCFGRVSINCCDLLLDGFNFYASYLGLTAAHSALETANWLLNSASIEAIRVVLTDGEFVRQSDFLWEQFRCNSRWISNF